MHLPVLLRKPFFLLVAILGARFPRLLVYALLLAVLGSLLAASRRLAEEQIHMLRKQRG